MDEDMMAAWLREVYTKRRDGFFHTSPAMLICDSMRAHLTDAVKIQVKRMNTELTIIPGGLTKELQPLDIGVNRSFKVKVRAAWERWMTDGEHTFTKTEGQCRSTYATISFTKAGITTGEPSNDSDINSDGDEPGASESSALGSVLGQFFMSDTEDEDFEGFMDEE
uniref:DDE-1 domain-containing protein n=1 Tax=Nothobranchius rachovii TaxID=451742 RepID=A0A1A8Q6G8_9TELE